MTGRAGAGTDLISQMDISRDKCDEPMCGEVIVFDLEGRKDYCYGVHHEPMVQDGYLRIKTSHDKGVEVFAPGVWARYIMITS